MVLDTCSPAVCHLQFLLMAQKPAVQGNQMELEEREIGGPLENKQKYLKQILITL